MKLTEKQITATLDEDDIRKAISLYIETEYKGKYEIVGNVILDAEDDDHYSTSSIYAQVELVEKAK